MMGRPGSGRARKASISFPRSATIEWNPIELGRPGDAGALPLPSMSDISDFDGRGLG
jgi:hypothetical protein